MRDVKGKKKGVYKYVNNRIKTKENLGLQLNGAAEVMANDMEKVKIQNAFYV